MPTRILFHGNIEEMRKHIQPTDGPTHQADLPLIRETKKISLIKISTKKFGDSLTMIRTPFHGNTEETRKLIQLTDMIIHLADLLSTKETQTLKISLIRILMKKFGAS